MREIKFRAWQKYHKKMVEVTSISFDDNGEINGVATFVENQAPQRISYRDDLLGRFFLKDECGMVLELMQYTGLKDKNGVEIYDGNIVRCFRDGPSEVVFKKGCFGLETYTAIGNYYSTFDEVYGYCEIIGNIYENPELLERETE